VGINHFFTWLANIQDSAINSSKYLLLTAYIWFVPLMKKPPDGQQAIHLIKQTMQWMWEFSVSTFDVNYKMGFWISFLLYNTPFLKNRLRCEENDNNSRYIYETRQRSTFVTRNINLVKRMEGTTLRSNVALSYSANIKEEEGLIDPIPHETNEYQFSVDTATSFPRM